jgi:AAA domain
MRRWIAMPLINFPEPKPRKVVETKMMKQIISRTMAVHTLSAIVVWYGESRIGKTTTAEHMVAKILEAYDNNNPLAFRAKYIEVGEIPPWSGNEMKKGIKSLYYAALRTCLDEGVSQREPPEAIAARLVHELQRRNIQLIFIDEAGNLSIDAIYGMVFVRDIALNLGWTLTLVFIGMGDLPVKMDKAKQQVGGRVSEWCYFVEYDIDDTWNLLAELHPHFASLDRKNEEHREQISFLRETYGGLPGQLVLFVQRMEYRLREHRGDIDLRFLRAVHLFTARDKQRSIQHSLTNFQGMPPEKAAKRAAIRANIDLDERSANDGSKNSAKASSKSSRARK